MFKFSWNYVLIKKLKIAKNFTSRSLLDNSFAKCVMLPPCLDELTTVQDYEQSECEAIYFSNLLPRKSLSRWQLRWSRFAYYQNYATKAPSSRIRIFLNPQLFLSGYENIRVHTLCDHSVFISNSPVHTYPDSLRIHWGLTKLSHQSLVRPGLTQYRRGRHCFPTRLSCFCRPFWPVDNVKSLQMSSRLLA